MNQSKTNCCLSVVSYARWLVHIYMFNKNEKERKKREAKQMESSVLLLEWCSWWRYMVTTGMGERERKKEERNFGVTNIHTTNAFPMDKQL